MEMFQVIEGCSDIQEQDVSEWINLEKDDPGHQFLSEDECSQQVEDDVSSDDDAEEKTGPNHTEATSMFEKLMSYLERQDDTSPAELLTMKRLRDRAARKRSSKLKQKNLYDFFTKE